MAWFEISEAYGPGVWHFSIEKVVGVREVRQDSAPDDVFITLVSGLEIHTSGDFDATQTFLNYIWEKVAAPK